MTEPEPTKKISELAPTTTEEYELMDQLDVQQILAEMKGDVLSEYIYAFCRVHKGKKVSECGCKGKNVVVGISWAGIKAIVHQLKNIDTELVRIEEDENEFRAIVKVTHKDRNISVYGASQQPRFSSRGEGRPTRDDFALAKVVSKAQRNAWRNLIPETVISELVKKHLGWSECPTEINLEKEK